MWKRTSALGLLALLTLTACGSSGEADSTAAVVDSTVVSSTAVPSTEAPSVTDTSVAETTVTETSVTETTVAETTTTTVSEAVGNGSASNCDEVAASFVTRGSANADLPDPEVSAVCTDGVVVINSNGIPDYTYIETSPGTPDGADLTFTIPGEPVLADMPTDVPLLGTAAVALNGVPIYGPTEGTGGDVLSLEGALSECGSHNGPTGFHIHFIGTSDSTDCLFTPEEVAAGSQLVGYAFDGFPIYAGNGQFSSSWQLTDESLFATDTWAAHTYVEGSGDLDECNGRTDADGNYAYFTTDTFPYVIGCYSGVVDLDAAGGGGGGAGGPGPGQPPPPPPSDG